MVRSHLQLDSSKDLPVTPYTRKDLGEICSTLLREIWVEPDAKDMAVLKKIIHDKEMNGQQKPFCPCGEG